MALVRVASVGGDAVVLYADVTGGGTCIGVRVENGTAADVAVILHRGDDIATGTYGPGVHTKSLPKPRQFAWTTADVRAELTVRWP